MGIRRGGGVSVCTVLRGVPSVDSTAARRVWSRAHRLVSFRVIIYDPPQ